MIDVAVSHKTLCELLKSLQRELDAFNPADLVLILEAVHLDLIPFNSDTGEISPARVSVQVGRLEHPKCLLLLSVNYVYELAVSNQSQMLI